MDASTLTTPIAAFIAGLATSLHCAGMCGPLACAARCKPLRYHSSRVVSYTLAGALLGGLGWSVRSFFDSEWNQLVPWVLAAALVVIGFGLDKRIPQPAFARRLLIRARLSNTLGWLTPLLPCGPLWMMFGVAIVTGSWMKGSALLLAFALGTIPLFLVLQAGLLKLQQRGGKAWLPLIQRGFALVAAGLLVWRAVLIEQGGCCH